MADPTRVKHFWPEPITRLNMHEVYIFWWGWPILPSIFLASSFLLFFLHWELSKESFLILPTLSAAITKEKEHFTKTVNKPSLFYCWDIFKLAKWLKMSEVTAPKLLFVTAIMLGCFAVMLPKMFSPTMFEASNRSNYWFISNIFLFF